MPSHRAKPWRLDQQDPRHRRCTGHPTGFRLIPGHTKSVPVNRSSAVSYKTVQRVKCLFRYLKGFRYVLADSDKLGVATLGAITSSFILNCVKNPQSEPSHPVIKCKAGSMGGSRFDTLETYVNTGVLAEAVRFELTEDSHPRQFSRLLHSTALPSFRN